MRALLLGVDGLDPFLGDHTTVDLLNRSEGVVEPFLPKAYVRHGVLNPLLHLIIAGLQFGLMLGFSA